MKKIRFGKGKKKRSSVPEWQKLEAIPQVVLSKDELDRMEQEVLAELSSEGVMHPYSLFYIHKYIDAKFSKNNFDIDTLYAMKQNKIDRLYADGIGQVHALFTCYKEALDDLMVARDAMVRAGEKLDPENAECDVEKMDDSAELEVLIKSIPDSIDWSFDEK